MKNITEATQRNDRLIGGVKVTVPAPYAEGQTITAGEAAMLNQTLAENISNNLREKVQKYVPEGSPEGTVAREATGDEAQALVNAYVLAYEPGVRRAGIGGRRVLDPVEKEMRIIARSSLDNLLKTQGVKRNEVNYDELLDQVLEEHGDAIRKKAEKIVKQRSEGDLGLDLAALKTAASEPAAEEGEELEPAE